LAVSNLVDNGNVQIGIDRFQITTGLSLLDRLHQITVAVLNYEEENSDKSKNADKKEIGGNFIFFSW